MVYGRFELQEESSQVYGSAYTEAGCMGGIGWVYMQQ